MLFKILLFALAGIFIYRYLFGEEIDATQSYLEGEEWIGVARRKSDGQWQAIKTRYTELNRTDNLVKVYYNESIMAPEGSDLPDYFYTSFPSIYDAVDFCRAASATKSMNATAEMVFDDFHRVR